MVIGMEWKNWEFFLGKKVKVVLKDTFLKYGILKGYNEKFIFLEYDDGVNSSIAIDQIKEIVVLGVER